MKAKQVIAFVLALSVLTLTGILFYNGSGSALPQLTAPTYSKPILPQVDWPLPNAEELSLAESQARVAYSIPLPEDVEIQKIWATNAAVEISERSVAIQFVDDLLLIVHPMKQSPDWEGIIASTPVFVKVEVNGNPGIGVDPGYTEVNGMKYTHPGSVEWWVNGLDITLYSNTYSFAELLKVAQSMR